MDDAFLRAYTPLFNSHQEGVFCDFNWLSLELAALQLPLLSHAHVAILLIAIYLETHLGLLQGVLFFDVYWNVSRISVHVSS